MADDHSHGTGGLTPEVMLLAALLAMPALWHCMVDGDLAFYLAAERYLLIMIACAVLSTLVHGYSESGRAVRERLDRLDEIAARDDADPRPGTRSDTSDTSDTSGTSDTLAPAALFDGGIFDDDLGDLGDLDMDAPLAAPLEDEYAAGPLLLGGDPELDAVPSFSLYDD